MRRETHPRITAMRAFRLYAQLERAPEQVREHCSVREVREALAEHVRHEITKRKRGRR